MDSELKGELIARGRTADVYAWGERQALKLFYDWVPAEWVRHEEKIGRFIAAVPLPTPKLIDAVSLDGRLGILYERIEGVSMLSLVSSQPWRISALARQFAGLHAEVHGQRGDGLSPLRPSLEGSIERVDVLAEEEKQAIIQALNRLPDGTALCHFDFHPGQVMMTPRGPAIIDWMTAMQGDPLADVARTAVLLTFGEVPHAGWLVRTLTNTVKGAFLRSYLRRYLELHPGVTRAQVEAWMLPVAAARLQEDIPGEREPILKYIREALEGQTPG